MFGVGAGTTNRTRDLLITSQLLYRLSYAGLTVSLRKQGRRAYYQSNRRAATNRTMGARQTAHDPGTFCEYSSGALSTLGADDSLWQEQR